MPAEKVALQFDEISRVYDETREPLDVATLEGMVTLFRRAGIASILEVGVGTGRVAQPLTQQGLRVTGVDVSSGMLSRARAKGVGRLIRASGYRLPFPDGAFDASLFVHVIHLLDEPLAALREGTRVGRTGAFALVHPLRARDNPNLRAAHEARRILREALIEQGYTPAPRLASPWAKERELLTTYPPDELEVVSDQMVTRSLRSSLDRLSQRGHRALLEVPPELMERALMTARERVGDRTVTYRQVEAVARWSVAPGPPPRPGSDVSRG